MSQSRSETVAAVVVTYNRKALLAQCLDALLMQSRPLDAIYVIDNASTDGTRDLIEQGYRGRASYQCLPENLGGAGGFHHGMKLAYEAGHDWIWVTDDDGIAYSDTLEKLLEVLRREPTAVAGLPGLVTPEGRRLASGLVYDRLRNRAIAVVEEPGQAEPYDIDYAGFVGPLIRREALRAAGFPLPELFFGYDDYEYSCRLRTVGRILGVPAALVRHNYASMTAAVPYAQGWRQYYWFRNLIYLRKRIIPPRSARWLLNSALRQACAILLKRDHKLGRLRILVCALCHGFTGRMGRGPMWLHR